MINEELNQPVTKKYLGEFTEKVVFPRVEEIVEEKITEVRKDITQFKDEILTSNDKLSVKLDKILAEQAAITAAYKTT